MPFTVTTEYEISYQQVADLMDNALEGGSNHWLNRVEPPYENVAAYADSSSYLPGMKPREFYADDDSVAYQFNREAITKGLRIMATDHARHFSDILNDNVDADTADVFLQCVLFGDVIYG